MAKTPTERVREFRERKRLEQKTERKALKAAIRANFKTPFSEFLEDRDGHGFSVHHSILGNNWWDFSNDDGIKPLTDDDLDEEEMSDAANSLGKAELILSVLEDVTDTLAEYVNAYKKKEIADRIHEIEISDISDPHARKQAFADIHRLKTMREQLSKPRRRNLPRWEVTGK